MTKILSKEIAFNGKLRTAIDGASIGANDFQTLINLRPTETNVRGIGGMTKINTSALASTGIRNGFHFRKSLPAEYHVLAWTSDGKVWVNNTAVPSQGAFEASALFTDTAGGSTGRFSNAPGGALAYANSKEACLWGGTEHRCAGFIDYPTTEQIYDYSDLIINNKADANNVATIHAVNAPIDANTMLLLHLDNNATDSSPTTPHTVTPSIAGYIVDPIKFGTHAADFNGVNNYLSIPDDADFDFSGGIFNIDFWMRRLGTVRGTLYYHATDANNYFVIYTLNGYIYVKVVASSVEVVSMQSSTTTAYWGYSHVAVVENSDNWYIFIDGVLSATLTDTSRCANYGGTVYIGGDGAPGTYHFYGDLDEFRVSNTARWTSSFTPPSAPYGTGYASTTYIGSIMPLSGFKAYVATANDVASTMAVSEWDGSGWTALTVTDNTTSGGISLVQTGTVTWNSTAATSKPTVVDKVYLYWYKMVITSASDFSGATLSQVTVSIPFQTIKDVWDGDTRPMNSVVGLKAGVFSDFTSNVLENSYTSTGATVDTSTYAAISSYTSTDYLYAGCNERLSGLIINVVPAYVNANSSIMSVDYWNGSAWTSLHITDGTANGAITLARSGWVTWNPPARASEFMRTDIGPGKLSTSTSTPQPGDPGYSYWLWSYKGPKPTSTTGSPTALGAGKVYYYRIGFSATLDGEVAIYHMAGISTPKDIRGYAFPMLHQNRTVLISNSDGKKNSVLMSAADTSNVFNGLDSYEFSFGQESEINAAASMFLRFGSSVQDLLMLAKVDEIHLLEGNGSDSDPYRTRLLSAVIGCRAPLTMATIPVGDLGLGVRRQIAVFESQRGIEVFDGSSLMDPLLSTDISDKFDPKHANYAGSSSNTGFYDATEDEYHWCPVGASEWVYSFKYKKWYQTVRGTAKYLYGGFPVLDTSGNSYAYGFDNAGYIYRLENGTTFDGNGIAHTLRLGDMAFPEGSIMEKSRVNWFRLVAKAKTVTSENIVMVYYNDTQTASYGSKNISPVRSGYRLITDVSYNMDLQSVFHGFQFSITTTTETIGFEPLYLGIRYTVFPDQLS